MADAGEPVFGTSVSQDGTLQRRLATKRVFLDRALLMDFLANLFDASGFSSRLH